MRAKPDFFPGLRKMIRRHLCPVIGVFIAAGLTVGWGGSWEALRQGAKEIRTVQADFTQEKQMKLLLSPLVSRGKFYFRMPDALRWEYTGPVQSILITDRGRTRRYLKGRDGWMEDDASGLQAMQVAIGEITRWLKGSFDKNKDFAATLTPAGEIILIPRQEGLARIIRRIVLRLSDRPGLMESVTIYEDGDSLTRLTFRNAVLNHPVDEALFREAP